MKYMYKNQLFGMQIEHKGHQFRHLLILDFEATCIKDSKPDPCPQIIEFPVVPINLATQKLQPFMFHFYVRPTLNPKLSQFCTELTGIRQETVDKGITLEEALQKFKQWLDEHKIQDFAFVTCGDWDLRSCLPKEANAKKIVVEDCFKQWINAKQIFPETFSKIRVKSMPHMLQLVDLQLQGRHHSGIDDCKNIARVMLQLMHKYEWKALRSMLHKSK